MSSIIFTLSIDVVILLYRGLNDRWEDRGHLQVLHETAMFEHSAASLEVASANLDHMATDADRWLCHM